MNASESLRQLLRQSHHARPDDLPQMAMRAAPLLNATAIILYLVDHQQRLLIPLLGGTAPQRDPFAVDGTLAGRAFTLIAPCVSDTEPGGVRLWLPLVDGAERLGVVEFILGSPPGDDTLDGCAAVASLLAGLVVTRSLYSDAIEQVRRREPMQLAAEMLRAQLPPLTFSTGHLVISGVLEPAYDVGGDAFDYAVNADTAHLALFDAVGHGSAGGLRPVMLASLALAAYRNARRAGLDLTATYHHIDTAVHGYDRGGFITAVLAEFDQRTGTLKVISAGHPSGIVIRDGKVVKILPTPTALPVVMGRHRPPLVVEEVLEPGDRLLLYTDGIIEARALDGAEFGLDRLIDFAVKAAADQLSLPETARRLVHAIHEHQDDQLQDDATVLLAEWRTPAPPASDTELLTAPPGAPLDLPT
ncbi:stage II sporulation protein E [Actinoplanes sp. SE50]|uniref:PP2C family protein-serine/threonine phosphatase n=1 Tax=unclassified Actinoplanes TaxID=2626549 RepID=UPI00023ED6E9|nr:MULTISPECIES: PP2C family protein-serine/threonine phosphatase [unclassified Actinoplanes]AEV81199.1 Protein icfG [Actinoplanes sp. SE50/110]ATO79601.1 stage II sporulation protein E [Actinoplanes sp. SE50]SLL97004.1 stage II sporulation protein E [Actinoplanes sp. SE50/110]